MSRQDERGAARRPVGDSPPSPAGPEPERAPEPESEADDVVTITVEPGTSMADIEREAILAVLRKAGGNRRAAAEALQIGERTLYRRLRRYGIDA